MREYLDKQKLLMEILEHGKTYLVYTCPRCRCVFVACEIDSYKDGLGGKGWVKCPECGEEIELREAGW